MANFLSPGTIGLESVAETLPHSSLQEKKFVTWNSSLRGSSPNDCASRASVSHSGKRTLDVASRAPRDEGRHCRCILTFPIETPLAFRRICFGPIFELFFGNHSLLWERPKPTFFFILLVSCRRRETYSLASQWGLNLSVPKTLRF